MPKKIAHILDDTAGRRILSEALIGSDSAILITDPSSLTLYVNEGFETMFGYKATDLMGRKPSSLLVKEGTDVNTLADLQSNTAIFQRSQAELLLYRSDSTPIWVSLLSTPVFDKNSEPSFLVVVLMDITESKLLAVLQHRVLEALAQESQLLDIMHLICTQVEHLIPEVRLAIASIDNGHLSPLAAPSLPNYYGTIINALEISADALDIGAVAYTKQEVIVEDITQNPRFDTKRARFVDMGIGACWSMPITSTKLDVIGVLTVYYAQPTSPKLYHRRIMAVCSHLAQLALEREHTREHMRRHEFYDELTQLPNRVMFYALCNPFLEEAKKDHRTAAILFIDLDRFKLINETQGHIAGDNLLRDISKRLTEYLDHRGVITRIAGDEFVIFLPDYTAEQASSIAERLLSCIHDPLPVGQVTIYPSASIGISMFPSDGQDISILIRHADLATHRVKPKGGGSFHFFSVDLDDIAQKRIALESELQQALESNQLALFYQPQIIAINPSVLYGVEALIRWKHPSKGYISPGHFLPLAEENGLMIDLGRWVIARATCQLSQWRALSIPVPRVSINLSPAYFSYPQMASDLLSKMQQHRLRPSDITLEITESMILSQEEAAVENIQTLKKAGICMSLDDFGTGYSSLSHLHRLPIDELKLDMSFVHDLESSQQARALTTSILSIGRALNMHVVAEGVETHAQRDFLTALGCEVLQGFLFSPPVISYELERWLEQLQ